jgi:hypothetical protein
VFWRVSGVIEGRQRRSFGAVDCDDVGGGAVSGDGSRLSKLEEDAIED